MEKWFIHGYRTRHATAESKVSIARVVLLKTHARQMDSVLEMLDTSTVAAALIPLGRLRNALRRVEMVSFTGPALGLGLI